MELNGEKISNKQVTLDGNSFIDCEISSCVLVYKGGTLPVLRDCQINDCQWNFSDQAANTLQFMSAMYNGMGMGGMEIVDQTIINIRNNTLVTPQQAAQAGGLNTDAANEDSKAQQQAVEGQATSDKSATRKIKAKAKAKTTNTDAA